MSKEADKAQLIDGMVQNLIVQYLSVVKEIKERKKKRINPQERKTYLKRMLTPLLAFSNAFYKSDFTYNFIDESIWIDEEIDIKQLIYDKEKYRIEPDPFNKKAYHPDRSVVRIHEDVRKYRAEREKKDRDRLAHIEQLEREGAKVPDSLRYSPHKVDGGRTSIRELYEKWLPSLTREVMISKDLLDQVLVTFTIKRALNGDRAAIYKLYALYKDTAIGTAYNIAKKRKLLHYAEEIKQEAKLLLLQIISGSGPKAIIDELVNDRTPGWFEISYFNYLSEHIPKKLNEIFTIPPDDRLGSRPWWRPQKAGQPASITNLPLKLLDELEIRTLLNVYSPIMHNTSLPKEKCIMKFNSYSFRPNKETNLTTWLFGSISTPKHGKLPQLLNDKMDQLAKTFNETLAMPVDVIDRKNYEKPPKNALQNLIDQDAVNSMIQILAEQGVSERDISIFKKNKLNNPPSTQQSLALEYGLSRVHINRICSDIKTLLKKIKK